MGRMEALILGIIQGLTEFMPISSSGHMELMKAILGSDMVHNEEVLFSVMVHFATALATLVAFWPEVIRFFRGLFRPALKQDFLFSISILLSMIPAAVVGYFLETTFAGMVGNGNLLLVGIMLGLTGTLLVIANNTEAGTRTVTPGTALLMGMVQILAFIPGLSRSGIVISTALIQKVEKTEAVRFAFLMVVPLIFGKMAQDILGGTFTWDQGIPQYLLIGFIAAFITGLWVCRWMVHLVAHANLNYFALYCFLVGLASILVPLIA